MGELYEYVRVPDHVVAVLSAVFHPPHPDCVGVLDHGCAVVDHCPQLASPVDSQGHQVLVFVTVTVTKTASGVYARALEARMAAVAAN